MATTTEAEVVDGKHTNGSTPASDVKAEVNGSAKPETSPASTMSAPVLGVAGKNGSKDKTILQNIGLTRYILESSVYPREHEQLKELREKSEKHPNKRLLSPADEGSFLQLFLKAINAKNTMEIGVFTGYSLLATALSIPEDGKIIAMDINRDFLNVGWPTIEKAGVAHKIDFREGPAMDTLDVLLKDEKYYNYFDFVFVDADKDNYINYHPKLLQLVRMGGIIAYDNTLWNGTVALTEEQMEAVGLSVGMRQYQPFIVEFNKFLVADPKIELSLLSVGDGVTLCRRVV